MSEERKPKSALEFLELLAAGKIHEVPPPPGAVYQFAEEEGGDHFFARRTGPGALDLDFRTGYAQLHDTPIGLAWGFREGPADRFVQAVRRVGGLLLRGARNVGVGLVLEKLGVKLDPARSVLERAAGATEDQLVRWIVETYGPSYVVKVMHLIEAAQDPNSPGGREITDAELRSILDEGAKPDLLAAELSVEPGGEKDDGPPEDPEAD